MPESSPNKPHLLAWAKEQWGPRIFIVHRLDKEVSGVILFARTPEAHRHLCMQFEERKIRKEYLALLRGVLTDPVGSLEQPLRVFGSGRVAVDPKGKPSHTLFTVAKRYATSTLVRAEPRTGRRHQIRAHFYALGHPVIGDPLYGTPPLGVDAPRLMLHAQRLTITHPKGTPLSVEAPLPESFTTVWDQWKKAMTEEGDPHL